MIYVFEDFRLCPTGFTLTKNEYERDIEPQVLDLIVLLVENHGQLITKDDIIEQIWDGQIRSESSISTLVSQARAALDDSGKSQKFIKTVHNKGYKFIGAVTLHETHDNIVSNEDPPPGSISKTKGKPVILAVSALFVMISIVSVLHVKNISPSKLAQGSSEKMGTDSAANNSSRGYSLNPNIIPEGNADSFNIVDYRIGDALDGANGVDTLDLSQYSKGGFFVGLFAEKARDQRYPAGEGEFNVVNIENIIGTPFDDVFRGSIFPNVIRGGEGDDQLYGYGDKDVIYGGPGNDYLNGGYDIDIINGGLGDDRILVATVSRGDHIDGGTGIDTFDLSKFTASPYHVDLSQEFSQELSDRGVDIYKLVKIENVVGTAMNDTIIGSKEDNVLEGGGGNDILNGGDGEDIAVYQGEHINYVFRINTDGSLKITDKFGYDGIDIVTDVETFKFSDTSLSLDIIRENIKPKSERSP